MLECPVPGFTAAGLALFAVLVGPDGVWDLKPYLKGATTAHCPSGNCDYTVTLCDVCIRRDMPGNIFYGYIGRFLGISEGMLLVAADAAQRLHTGKPDPKEDQQAIIMGFCIYDATNGGVVTRDAICRCLSHWKYGMATSPDCKPCSAKFPGMIP